MRLYYDGNAGEEVPEIPLRRLLIGLAENMRGFPCNTKTKRPQPARKEEDFSRQTSTEAFNEGENMKLIKRITAYLLTFSILLSISSVCSGCRSGACRAEYPAHEDPSQEMLTDLEQRGYKLITLKIRA